MEELRLKLNIGLGQKETEQARCGDGRGKGTEAVPGGEGRELISLERRLGVED